jgi:hypothetical protein
LTGSTISETKIKNKQKKSIMMFPTFDCGIAPKRGLVGRLRLDLRKCLRLDLHAQTDQIRDFDIDNFVFFRQIAMLDRRPSTAQTRL